MPKARGIIQPNLGVYLDRPPIAVDPRAMSDCMNVRIKNGRVTNSNLGYVKFFAQQLNGPVLLIDNFFLRSGAQLLVLGTTKDLYQYDEVGDEALFLTPRYDTGTVTATNGSAVVTGVGTLWDTSDNLKVGDGFHVGAAAQRDPAETWYTILTVDSDTQVTLTANYAEATAGPGEPYTGRQLFQGAIFDYWRTESFPDAQPEDEDHWYATNGGINYPVRWNGTDTQVTVLDTLGFKCKELGRYKNMLIYGNLIIDTGEARPFSVRNSAITEPENVTTLEAAEFVVHDGVDPIVGMLPFGDNLFIYSERSVTIVQFVGAPVLFAFRTGISGIGPLNGRMVADFGDFHTLLAADSLYRFDGIGVENINGHVWVPALKAQDPKRLELAFSHFDEENGELHWIIPRTTDTDTTDGQPETSYVEHYLEEVGERDPNPHTIRSMPFTVAGFFERLTTLTWNAIITDWTAQNFAWNDRFLQSAFPYNLFGDENGYIYILNSGETADGVAQVNYARFGQRLLGDGKSKGLLKRVYGYFEPLPAAGYGVDVTIRSADSIGGVITTSTPLVHDITQADELDFFVSPFVIARTAAVEFGTDGTNEPWTLQGYDIDVAPAGKA